MKPITSERTACADDTLAFEDDGRLLMEHVICSDSELLFLDAYLASLLGED